MPGRIAIVVPCFNEEARLPDEAFARFGAEHPEVDFVMVDDGSTDGTVDLLRKLEGRLPGRVQVVALAGNRGKAEAVRQGMRAAFRSEAEREDSEGAEPEYVGYWDADLAAPLDELPAFVRVLERHPGAVLAMGSRVQLLGRRIERRALRHYPGRVFATLASETLGLAVYDTQCGAKLFRNTEEVRALFEEPFVVGWTFDVELLARLIAGRARSGGPAVEVSVHEVPLRRWVDLGESKVRPLDFLRALWELARIRRRYFRIEENR